MKLIIASPHCTKIDLIEYQYKSIKKFIKDEDYEYIIFNDASSIGNINNFYQKDINNKIHNKCKELNVRCIDVPQYLHKDRTKIFPNTTERYVENPTTRCSVSVQYIFNYFKNDDVILMIIESDMFFMKEINVENYLGNCKVSYLEQSRKENEILVRYMWVGILIFNLGKIDNKELINFDCGKVKGVLVDAGGNSYQFVESLNETDIKNCGYANIESFDIINELIDNNIVFDDKSIELFKNIQNFYEGESINGELYLNHSLYHIRGFGSNWNISSKYYYNYIGSKKVTDENQNVTNEIVNDITIMKYWKEYCENLSQIFKKYIDNL